MIANLYFFLAGIAALATFGLHAFVGGRLFAAPLLATQSLPRVVRLTLYYCWHIVTVVIAAMSGGFFVLAVLPEHSALAIALAGLATALSILSLSIIAVHRVRPVRMPQWLFFGIIAGFAVGGLTAL